MFGLHLQRGVCLVLGVWGVAAYVGSLLYSVCVVQGKLIYM